MKKPERISRACVPYQHDIAVARHSSRKSSLFGDGVDPGSANVQPQIHKNLGCCRKFEVQGPVSTDDRKRNVFSELNLTIAVTSRRAGPLPTYRLSVYRTSESGPIARSRETSYQELIRNSLPGPGLLYRWPRM